MLSFFLGIQAVSVGFQQKILMLVHSRTRTVELVGRPYLRPPANATRSRREEKIGIPSVFYFYMLHKWKKGWGKQGRGGLKIKFLPVLFFHPPPPPPLFSRLLLLS